MKCGSESFTRRLHKGGFPALAGSSTSQISGMLQPGLEDSHTGSQGASEGAGEAGHTLSILPSLLSPAPRQLTEFKKSNQSNLHLCEPPSVLLRTRRNTAKLILKKQIYKVCECSDGERAWLPSASATYQNVHLDSSLNLTPTFPKWEIPLAWLCIRINRDTVSGMVTSM